MIGLDTNVLVRYLVQDDAAQSAVATRVIERQCTTDTPGFVDHIVLCELAWVLDAAYDYGRELIAHTLHQILATAELRVAGSEQVRAALRAYEQGGADFADYLIGLRNADAGCRTTVTFNRRAARFATHELVK